MAIQVTGTSHNMLPPASWSREFNGETTGRGEAMEISLSYVQVCQKLCFLSSRKIIKPCDSSAVGSSGFSQKSVNMLRYLIFWKSFCSKTNKQINTRGMGHINNRNQKRMRDSASVIISYSTHCKWTHKTTTASGPEFPNTRFSI